LQTDPTSRSARTPRRLRTVQEKEAILAAARDLFLTQRYELISSAEIARRAGVEEALPARYFGGKLALLIRIGEDMAEQVLAEFAAPPAREGPADRLFRTVAVDLFTTLAAPTSQRLHHLFCAQAREVQRLKERWRQRLVAAAAARLQDGFTQFGAAAADAMAEEAAGLLYDLFLAYLAPTAGTAPPEAREVGYWAEAASAMLIRRRAARADRSPA
jgi:AcrR family transcriptional regulator